MTPPFVRKYHCIDVKVAPGDTYTLCSLRKTDKTYMPFVRIYDKRGEISVQGAGDWANMLDRVWTTGTFRDVEPGELAALIFIDYLNSIRKTK